MMFNFTFTPARFITCISLFAGVCAALVTATATATAQQTPSINSDGCYEHGWSKARLLTLPAKQFQVTAAEQAVLWQQLRFCLAESDPQIRDDVAFAGYSHWLRSGVVDPTSALQLLQTMQQDLATGVDDTNQVYRPFAMLLLSELARLDRVKPYLTARQRQQLVQTVADFLRQLTDLRGFDAKVGWRHGIAHAADAVMQLALNSAIGRLELLKLRDALTIHLMPQHHAYTDGEPARLARALVYLLQRPEITEQEWQLWLSQASLPPQQPLYQSRSGLNYLHNSRALWLETSWLLEQLGDTRSLQFKVLLQAQLKQ